AEPEILARSQAEEIQRAEEDARFRMEAETLRRAAEELARRRAQAKAAHVAEEEARRRAEEENRQRLAEEARRRAEEQQSQTEVEARRRATEERLKLEQDALMQAAIELTRRRAEVEEARRRVERETRLLAQEQVRKEEERRRLAEEERVKLEAQTELHAQEEKSRFEESRDRAENERRRVEELHLFKAEEREQRLTVLDAMKKQAEEQARQRAAQEQRIRAEIEVLRQAELEQHRLIEAETRRRADAEARLREEQPRSQEEEATWLSSEETPRQESTEAEKHPEEEREVAQADTVFTNNDETSVPPVSTEELPSSDNRGTESGPESSIPSELFRKLNSNESHERALALAELAAIGGEDFFSFMSRAFDDESEEVRNAAALALYNVQPDRAAAFTRALREGSPERRHKIGSALATSGLASEAISNLTGDSREKTYDAFSLLFLMAKAGEVEPLMKAIEDHPSIEVRLAVVKLLALSGQPGILPEFRQLAVRGSLPSEVRAAVMEAIYQISSQAEESAHSAA
ncbi:MAG TPA: HEAT repeat domain-containing protein, partial [Pyrinomonadaceae bacterium]|nr:HEAT repeat domain-containing protein [Pyrinomonadaceae bacterium]